VQLSDDVNSTSTALAATANAVKKTYDRTTTNANNITALTTRVTNLESSGGGGGFPGNSGITLTAITDATYTATQNGFVFIQAEGNSDNTYVSVSNTTIGVVMRFPLNRGQRVSHMMPVASGNRLLLTYGDVTIQKYSFQYAV